MLGGRAKVYKRAAQPPVPEIEAAKPLDQEKFYGTSGARAKLIPRLGDILTAKVYMKAVQPPVPLVDTAKHLVYSIKGRCLSVCMSEVCKLSPPKRLYKF